MTVKELREKLQQNGYGEEVNDMSKKELQQIADALTTMEETLSKAEEVPTDVVDVPFVEGNIVEKKSEGPSRTDPEWTDYVLEQFIDREKDESGNPKVDGLRRVAEKLLGPFDILTNVVQAPKFDTGATVVVTLQFSQGGYGIQRVVQGAADVSTMNTQREYAMHAVATAETRAEGRALRKALGLTKVLAAEELQNADPSEADGTEKISTSMLSSLKFMCQKVNVDIEAIAKKEFDVTFVSELTSSEGRKIATLLYKYNAGEEEIPDDIKTISI